jgi:hypothetical protein
MGFVSCVGRIRNHRGQGIVADGSGVARRMAAALATL